MDEAKAVKPNLDYPAGPTYHRVGFDTPCSLQCSLPAASLAERRTSRNRRQTIRSSAHSAHTGPNGVRSKLQFLQPQILAVRCR